MCLILCVLWEPHDTELQVTLADDVGATGHSENNFLLSCSKQITNPDHPESRSHTERWACPSKMSIKARCQCLVVGEGNNVIQLQGQMEATLCSLKLTGISMVAWNYSQAGLHGESSTLLQIDTNPLRSTGEDSVTLKKLPWREWASWKPPEGATTGPCELPNVQVLHHPGDAVWVKQWISFWNILPDLLFHTFSSKFWDLHFHKFLLWLQLLQSTYPVPCTLSPAFQSEPWAVIDTVNFCEWNGTVCCPEILAHDAAEPVWNHQLMSQELLGLRRVETWGPSDKPHILREFFPGVEDRGQSTKKPFRRARLGLRHSRSPFRRPE